MREARKVVYEAACEVLEEAGYEGNFRPDYSGRAMYGKTCPGIVSDAGSALVGWAVCVALIRMGWEIEEGQEMVPVRTDSMGLSKIYY